MYHYCTAHSVLSAGVKEYNKDKQLLYLTSLDSSESSGVSHIEVLGIFDGFWLMSSSPNTNSSSPADSIFLARARKPSVGGAIKNVIINYWLIIINELIIMQIKSLHQSQTLNLFR